MKNSIACVHLPHFTLKFARLHSIRCDLAGMGVSRQTRAATRAPCCAVDENCLAQIFDGRLAPELQRLAAHSGSVSDHAAHHGRGQKIENIRAQRGVASSASSSTSNQLAGAHALRAHSRLQHRHHGPEDLFDQSGSSAFALALAQANHLLLHQALEGALRVDAVKVIERETEQPLARPSTRVRALPC